MNSWSLDWNRIPVRFRWFAIDENGSAAVYENKPVIGTGHWCRGINDGGDILYIGKFRLNKSWKKSLEHRKQVSEEKTKIVYTSRAEKIAHKAHQQMHFDIRLKERLGIEMNREKTRPLLKYLLSTQHEGICSTKYNAYYRNRYWFYVKIEGAWLWVLVDYCTERLVTGISEVPRGLTEEETTKAIQFGTSPKRPWNS